MTIAGATLSCMALALLQDPGSFWMPPKSSTVAGEVDWLFWFIFWVSAFFFALIVVLMVLFVVRYRQRPGHAPTETAHHNLALEVTWSVIPLILVISIFWIGFKTYLNMATPPPGAYEIRVTGQKWQWLFTYPNGWVDPELHAPKGVPVKLLMTSEDVIHSLYIPAFRLKKDVVPGRYTTAWFEATETGDYYLFCAEYCGTEHSGMITRVVVHEPQGYLDWLENASNFYDELPPVEAGEQMLAKYGCVQCHYVDGRAHTGPPLNDLFGREEKMSDGQMFLADENYIRESIIEPLAHVVSGYQGVMPTFQGKITDKEIDWIITYLKSISVHYEEPQLVPEAEAESPDAGGGDEAGAEPVDQLDEEPAAAGDTESAGGEAAENNMTESEEQS